MNYQEIVSSNGSVMYDYVRVGGWDSGNLTIDSQKILWPNQKRKDGAAMVESVCSKPCPKGQVKVSHCSAGLYSVMWRQCQIAIGFQRAIYRFTLSHHIS